MELVAVRGAAATMAEHASLPHSPASGASPAHQLDDGYGSSNSSPHSSGE